MTIYELGFGVEDYIEWRDFYEHQHPEFVKGYLSGKGRLQRWLANNLELGSQHNRIQAAMDALKTLENKLINN